MVKKRKKGIEKERLAHAIADKEISIQNTMATLKMEREDLKALLAEYKKVDESQTELET